MPRGVGPKAVRREVHTRSGTKGGKEGGAHAAWDQRR